ncbi:LysR family transcriptional regulator [Affinibrenneria salicis]|uniref:LysR family transcriptional regulator n=1 Tax=Affinibrenneria salicis TaxID=2590031 RepID=A0A5J5G4R5_9GAMM|nr:LysR family transcriptional regulator [Affinibrenneria salicis]KAA9001922.1 LysR family transcriptional regulator [Affinibrenneria salicis]
MTLDNDLFPALNYFAAIARHGSFRAAARHLNMSPSAVSHAIAMLERRLGLKLLSRTTRSVALTPEGKVVLEGLDPALERIKDAIDTAKGLAQAIAGSLRIAAPRTVSEFLLTPLLLAFSQAYPRIAVELHADDALQDIVAGGFDFGVRFGDRLEQDMIAVAIGAPTRVLLVASPDYVRENGLPVTPDDVQRHRCLGRRFPGGGLFAWHFFHGQEQRTFTPDAILTFSDDLLLRQAALAGAGIGFAFEETVRNEIAVGRLVEILPDWASAPERCYLYWPGNPVARPAARTFIDFAKRY